MFSTKQRRQFIPAEVQPRLWAYMGGIARENRMKALVIGGSAHHVHVLLSMPATISISKAMQLIKGASSAWVKEAIPGMSDFGWQEGYGAFSIGVSQLADTVRYIERQAEHHRATSFQDEYRAFLRKHGIECDERYIWD